MADVHEEGELISVKEENIHFDDKQNEVTTSTNLDKGKEVVAEHSDGRENEDDVPADFFDDFANKDFLAGLDVVDAWEEKSGSPEKDGNIKNGSGSQDGRKRRVHRSRSRERYSERSCSKDRTERRRSKSLETRRDPSKTKRDIQKDKAKCAKAKEQKIISEKLKVVETGLVPPGMEMEFDLEHVERAKSRSPEYSRSKRVKSPAPKRRRYASPLRRPRSPVRLREASPHSYSRSYRRSPTPPLRDDRRGRDRSRKSPSPALRLRREILSPPRKRSMSFLEEINQKLSSRNDGNRLREITEKINGGPSIINKYGTIPLQTSAPPPNLPYQATTVYDAQFFIGPQEVPQANIYTPNPVPPPPPQDFQQYHPLNQNYYNQQVPIQQTTATALDEESLQKLFNDENVPLSQFLSSLGRTFDNSKPLDIKDKIKVITRCQDGINLLSEYNKPSGKFYYKKPVKVQEKKPEAKYQSPLKKCPSIQLCFTSKAVKINEQKITNPITKLLMKLGLQDQPIQAGNEAPLEEPSSRNTSIKFVQTEPFKCDECEIRKKKRTVEIGVQCTPDGINFGCQVTEDDFFSTARTALKSILKNQSLATLTPAQILAHSRPEEKKEVFPAARKIVEKPNEYPYNRMGDGNRTAGEGVRMLSDPPSRVMGSMMRDGAGMVPDHFGMRENSRMMGEMSRMMGDNSRMMPDQPRTMGMMGDKSRMMGDPHIMPDQHRMMGDPSRMGSEDWNYDRRSEFERAGPSQYPNRYQQPFPTTPRPSNFAAPGSIRQGSYNQNPNYPPQMQPNNQIPPHQQMRDPRAMPIPRGYNQTPARRF